MATNGVNIEALKRAAYNADATANREGIPPHVAALLEEEAEALRAAIAALEGEPKCETFEVGPVMVKEYRGEFIPDLCTLHDDKPLLLDIAGVGYVFKAGAFTHAVRCAVVDRLVKENKG